MDAPKNIRQIGETDSSHKIFIEDYVVTYTKNIGKEHEEKAAVLLGHKRVNDSDVETFINGMVVIRDFSLSQNAVFSNDRWSSIYDDIKEYYEDEEIVGWLYIGDGDEIRTDKRLVNIHTNNFNGKNVVFMHYNNIEQEETFYDYINSAFVKRKGFYIYYQKNETMHDYMISMNPEPVLNMEPEKAIRDFRNIMTNRNAPKKTRRLARSAYAAGMLAAAVALLVGTTVIYRQSDVTGRHNKQAGTETVSNDVVVSGQAVMSSTVVQAATDQSIVVGETEEAGELSGEPEDPEITETTEAEGSDEQTCLFYVVKPGDNLGSISEKIYNSVLYVDKIKDMNNIEDADRIDIGQKLLLPDAE